MSTHRLGHGRLALVVVATVLAVVGLSAGPATAHTQLVSTDPVDGAVLTAPPASVTLTFNEDLLAGANTISINDDRGNVIATQPVEPQGSVITAAWPAAAASGMFQVAYRVVSADGHPVAGAIMVTITGDGANAASTSASAVASPSSPPAAAVPEEGRGIAAGLVVALAVGVLVLIVIVAVAMMRRRPRA